jgi:hypothetical protein
LDPFDDEYLSPDRNIHGNNDDNFNTIDDIDHDDILHPLFSNDILANNSFDQLHQSSQQLGSAHHSNASTPSSASTLLSMFAPSTPTSDLSSMFSPPSDNLSQSTTGLSLSTPSGSNLLKNGISVQEEHILSQGFQHTMDNATKQQLQQQLKEHRMLLPHQTNNGTDNTPHRKSSHQSSDKQ